MEEGEDPPEGEGEGEGGPSTAFEYASNFREMMQYSAEDKKAQARSACDIRIPPMEILHHPKSMFLVMGMVNH